MKAQPILKEEESFLPEEAKQIIELLSRIDDHTVALRKKLMEELRANQ